jgi:hypothetical protein
MNVDPAARLSRKVHLDLVQIYSRWGEYFKLLSSEGFALLIILDGIRSGTKDPDRLNFGRLAADSASPRIRCVDD